MVVHHKGVQANLQFEVVDHVVPPDATHWLRCGYHNLLGLSQEDIKAKVKATIVPLVNGILAPMGWAYISVGVYGDYFEIYYKEASPVEPVTAGIASLILVTICVCVIGFVIVWVSWIYRETKMELAKAKQDKKKLLEEGKITNEQYTSMIEAQAEEDMFGAIGDIFPLLLIFLIIMVIAGAVGRRRD